MRKSVKVEAIPKYLKRIDCEVDEFADDWRCM